MQMPTNGADSPASQRRNGAGPAADKTDQQTANTPPSITLPKGGGTIHGIGEKFAADPVTGTGSLTIPIALSPGRNGFGPQLSLSYDSGAGNGPFGLGWHLALPNITRKTDKGLPLYRDAADSDTFLLSGAEDLVPVFAKKADGSWDLDAQDNFKFEETLRDGYSVRSYRPRTEGLFSRIERWTNQTDPTDCFWRSITGDNITNYYGKDGNSRITDPENALHIFNWLICESHDDKGNVIVYQYAEENPDNVDTAAVNEHNRTNATRSTNRYLKRILYGNKTSRLAQPDNYQDDGWHFVVVLDYAEGHYKDISAQDDDPFLIECSDMPVPPAKWPIRQDAFSDYRAGFEVRTYRLCQRILMFHDFHSLGDTPCLVNATDFKYKEDPVASFITGITHSGYVRQRDAQNLFSDRYLKKSIPPLALTYSCVPTPLELAQLPIETIDPASLENLPIGLEGQRYQWLDLDGEGISGILSEHAGGWYYKENLGAGHFGGMRPVAETPALGTDGSRHQFLDLAGNGQLDVVLLNAPTPGFYERTQDASWTSFYPFTSLPNLAWNDPNLKFVDLTGDGHADLIISEEQAFVWHASLGESGFSAAERVVQALDEEAGPHLLFADSTQSIYLADMSGDGLTDIARIRNGEICYWPNLGYGRFGAKVTMGNAPWFDTPDLFDHQRIRLADIDGSGATDIIYLQHAAPRLYFNQSGNRWSDPASLPQYPHTDNIVSVQVLDLLGSGTACLTWSSPLPGDASHQMRYIDLMGGQKPHLLIGTANNLGAETRISYVPSTQFYLADKLAGRPWITRLPFPVHVVERIETCDYISRNRFVTRHAFHHGYFDGVEREFRGFGMVEQWDTAEFAALSASDAFPDAGNIDAASHVPPVHTKTWFHTGIYLGRDRVSNFFAGLLNANDPGEYYREPGMDDADARQRLLNDTVLPADLSIDDEREACRALKGTMLRQEVYALDGTAREQHPYTVIEQNFAINLLQPRGRNRHGVFFTHAREAISYHYERNPADPRVSHAFTLEVDDYGNVLKSAAVDYGRRQADTTLSAQDQGKQTQTLITCTENRVTNAVNADDDYRTPLPCSARTDELTGLRSATDGNRYTFDEMLSAWATATQLDYAQIPTAGQLQKRPIECIRIRYRPNDCGAAQNDPLALLPPGILESLALPGEHYRQAFTALLAKQIYVDSGRLTPAELDNALAGDGRYVHSENDTHWWVPSGRIFYSPDSGDDANAERNYAAQHFFLPHRYRDPFHSNSLNTESHVRYDAYDLLAAETRDALDNIVTVATTDDDGNSVTGIDYRVLQPYWVTDPNGNRTRIAFDALGMVAGTAVMGKAAANQGDLLDGFEADLTQTQIDSLYESDDPHIPAVPLLQAATARNVYDLQRFQRSRQENPQDPTRWLPVYTATLLRETHTSDPLPADGLRIQINFAYADGFGMEIQQKIQAEPGPLTAGGPTISPRWVGSGWTIFDNKGNPVRRYEPFFSQLPAKRHQFEFGSAVGISPILFYDPLNRVIATLHPNHSYEKTVFDPWQQTGYDVNDTIAPRNLETGDPRTDPDIGGYVEAYFEALPNDPMHPWQTWYQQRIGGALGASEQAAAIKAANHADTPGTIHFDVLGRPYLTKARNRVVCTGHPLDGTESVFVTRAELDIEGNQREIRDPVEQNGDTQGRVAMRYSFDMLGNATHQISMEAGTHWVLNDVAGQPIHAWDSRGHHFATVYDALRRPTQQYVDGSSAASDPRTLNNRLLTNRIEYGESQSNAAALNLRTRIYRYADSAGIATSAQLDSNGNPIAAYDFKGNLLHGTRQFASDYKAIPDWSNNPQLDSETFTTVTRYDALNRAVQSVIPYSSLARAKRNVIQPVFNAANLLERVDVWLDLAATPTGLLDPAANAPSMVGIDNIDYDAKGQRLRIDYKNGVSTRYDYDPLTFRLMHLRTQRNAAAFPDDCPSSPPAGWPGCQVQSLHYTFDPCGNIAHIEDDAQQTVYFRNQRIDSDNDYVYDALYRLIEAGGREHLGQGGAPIPHSPNDAGRVGVSSADAYGHFSPNDGNAMGTYIERYVYDAAGNFLEMQHRGSNPAQGWSRTYTYAEISQIEDGSDGTLAKTGNRLSSTAISSNGNSPAAEPYLYDAQGNITRMPHLGDGSPGPNMFWNYANQLRQTELGGGGTAYYLYDAAGQRIRKVWEKAPGLTEERIYLGGFEIFRRHGGAIGTDTAILERETLHIMDNHQRIALVETRTLDSLGKDTAPAQLIRYQLGNHLGSSSLELDEQAQIISYEEYTPYGSSSYQAVRSQTESAKRYRYTGKERDEESGLYYHGARYYAPWLGRWISADPIGIADGLNLYLYVQCNPLIHVDPDGNFTKKTYDDWLDKHISAGEADVKKKEKALEDNKDAKAEADARLQEIDVEKKALDKQKTDIAAKRKPLEHKKTKRTKAEDKELKALKAENSKVVGQLRTLSAEAGRLKSKLIRLNAKIPLQEAGLKSARAELASLKHLKAQFDAAYAKATAKSPTADVELLTDLVMNEARDSGPTSKKAIAYAYTNDTAHHMKGGHVAFPPGVGKSGHISHFSAGVTETRFRRSTNKTAYIGQIIESIEASHTRLIDTKNTGDLTTGATNWVSPDALRKLGIPIPSWTKGMTKIIVPGIPAGEFTFYKK
jgi:RHS repeat-associated protein